MNKMFTRKVSLTLFLGVALLLPWSIANNAPAQGVLRIAAVVNEDVISAYDLAQRVRMVMVTSSLPNTPESRRRLTPQVLRNMIDEHLQSQEAKRLNVRVTEKEVDDMLARLNTQNDLQPGELETMLGRANVDVNALRSKLRAERAWNKVVRQRLQRQVFIGDEEVEEELARLRAVRNLPRHRIAEIFLSVDTPDSEASVRELAQRLLQQIKDGARFNALAREFSQSTSAAVGGDLGWVTKGQLAPELDRLLDDMTKNQIVGPIKTLSGYYILLLIDRRTPTPVQAAATKVSLTQLVLPLSAAPTPAELQAQQSVGLRIRSQVRSCDDMRQAAQSIDAPQSGDIRSISLDKLPPSIRNVVAPLRVGETSTPVRVAEGILMATLCSRTEDDTAGLPTREQITNRLGNKRFDLLVQRYMRDLRRTAFVDIRG